MKNEELYNVILLGQLHGHQYALLNNNSLELLNQTNKILIKTLNGKDITLEYNVFDNKKIVEIPITYLYDFLERLLKRTTQTEVHKKGGELVEVLNYKDELKSAILKIEDSKNYNHYLKKLKIDSTRFEVEYYDNIIVMRDKNKNLLTNVETLKNAVQHYI